MKKSSGITAESGFVGQIRKYGVRKIIFAWDFGISLCVFVLLLLNTNLHWNAFNSLGNDSLVFIVTVASAIFSVLITALAIILSFSSSNFVKFLREKDMFDRIIFIFWWTSIAFLSVLVLSFVKYLIKFDHAWLHGIGSAMILAIFVYGLIETYYVVGALMRFAYFLGYFESGGETKDQ